MGSVSSAVLCRSAITIAALTLSLACRPSDSSLPDDEAAATGEEASTGIGAMVSGTSTAAADTTGAPDSSATGGGAGSSTGQTLGSSTEAGGESGEETGNFGCIADTWSGAHRFDCDHLTFDISVPPRCATESCGLIVDVHGRTMSAQMQEANTGLAALGARRGYVVLQPNSNPAPPLSSWDGAADDPTVVEVVEQALDAFEIDPARVHLTGFSQGGSMTWRLLADHGELWASAAPAAACGLGLPSAVVPLLYMHGTADALTSYDCAEPHVDALREHYGLDGEGEVVDSSEDHRRTRYGGAGPALIELLSHDYDNGNVILGGHCYPGSSDPGGAPGQLFTFACGGDEAFAWGETVIDFFDAHPRAPR